MPALLERCPRGLTRGVEHPGRLSDRGDALLPRRVPLRHQEKSNNERTVPPHPYPSPAGCGDHRQGIRRNDNPPLPGVARRASTDLARLPAITRTGPPTSGYTRETTARAA